MSARSAAVATFCLCMLGANDVRDDADALIGTWTWSYKDGTGTAHTHILEVEGTGDKLAAREKYDDEEPMKVLDLKRSGKVVTFTVNRGKRRSSYTGTIKASDRIEGTVSVTTDGQANEFGWEARRERAKKK